MLQKILNIAKIAQASAKSSQVTNFNTTLPLLLEILQRTKRGYLLKLGNATMEAKSSTPLQVGARYFAVLNDKNGELLISNLQKIPKIAESAKNSPIVFTPKDLETMGKDFVREFRDSLLDSAINAKSKDEFLFLSNSLLALQQGILNLVIKDRNKRILLQIKRQKDKKIEFCAVFSNLGIIRGVVFDESILHLRVSYERVKKLLENSARELDFSEVSIAVQENSVLFEMVDEFNTRA